MTTKTIELTVSERVDIEIALELRIADIKADIKKDYDPEFVEMRKEQLIRLESIKAKL